MRYNPKIYKIKQTNFFSRWLIKLKDIQGKVAIIRRISRIKDGNFGDSKSAGGKIRELHIAVGAGYRVYFVQEDRSVVVLLIGGDKSTQSEDIEKAKNILKELEDGKVETFGF